MTPSKRAYQKMAAAAAGRTWNKTLKKHGDLSILIWALALTSALLVPPPDSLAVMTERQMVQPGPLGQAPPVTSVLEPSDAPGGFLFDTCQLLAALAFRYENAAIHVDSTRGVTEFYTGHFLNNCVIKHVIAADLSHVAETLAVPYGFAWIAEDFDLDGNIELVVQRGDGASGFLDIVSLPDGVTRQRFVFPGMNVVSYAQSVELTGDQYREIFLTPTSIGGVSVAVIIGYDVVSDSFQILAQAPSTYTTYQRAAIADFDNDGRFEMLQGNQDGVGIFEWDGESLAERGQAWSTGLIAGTAVGCRPKPGGLRCVLASNSQYYTAFYRFLEPVGDNHFRLGDGFERYAGVTGGNAAGAFDTDCDGLDEVVLLFYPNYEVWQWDTLVDSFVPSCSWSGAGGLRYWYESDLDWNGARDWVSISPGGNFWAFSGGPCFACDSQKVCSPPLAECLCVCHADPFCDGVVANAQDVVMTIDAAFRGVSLQSDPGPLCWPTQTDVNCDGSTNSVDVVRIINVAFRGAALSSEVCNPCTDSR